MKALFFGLGGGVVMTEIHELDLLGWFFGRPASVYAVGGTISDFDIDVEDTFAATLSFQTDKGILPTSLTMSFIQAPPSQRLAVNGEKGRAILEISDLRLTVLNTDGSERERFSIPDFDRNQMFLDELSSFIDNIRSGQKSMAAPSCIEDGMAVAFAVRKSLATNQLVDLLS